MTLWKKDGRTPADNERQPWGLVLQLLDVERAEQDANRAMRLIAKDPNAFTLESMDAVRQAANAIMARRSLLEAQLDDMRDAGYLPERPVVPELKAKK